MVLLEGQKMQHFQLFLLPNKSRWKPNWHLLVYLLLLPQANNTREKDYLMQHHFSGGIKVNRSTVHKSRWEMCMKNNKQSSQLRQHQNKQLDAFVCIIQPPSSTQPNWNGRQSLLFSHLTCGMRFHLLIAQIVVEDAGIRQKSGSPNSCHCRSDT